MRLTDKIDVTVPAVLRPEVLRHSLQTMCEGLLTDRDRYRLLINIDPVGDGTVDDMMAVCREYFGDVLANVPAVGSLNNALKWLWSTATSEYVFYTEDDIRLERPIDIDKMVMILNGNSKLAYLQVPHYPLVGRNADWKFIQHTYQDGAGWFKRIGDYKFALQPALIRRAFVRRAAGLINCATDPEIQFHNKNPKLAALVAEWEYGTYGKPGDVKACQDFGTSRKRGSMWYKHVGENGTSWLPIIRFEHRGQPLGFVDHPIGQRTVQDMKANKWRRSSFAVIDRFLRPGDTFMDIGAYVGTILCYATFKCVRAIGFEPDPVAYEVLAANVNVNRREFGKDKPIITNKAIADTNGHFMLKPMGPGFGASLSTFTKRGHAAKGIQVTAYTLQDGLARYGIDTVDFIKITNQGMEAPVLHAARGLLSGCKPVILASFQPALADDRDDYIRRMIEVALMYEYLYTEKGKPLGKEIFATPEWAERKTQTFVVMSQRAWE